MDNQRLLLTAQVGRCNGVVVVGGWAGRRSALNPAGIAVERVADLYWWAVAGAAAILAPIIFLTVYAVRARRR